ncbi:CGNR zinc finger domain-containing protein [Streptomyces sp. NPDC014983]|uniref:CGNR zinc finger domain-containing protein n=1 Tax=Streptomyces sp. NPDC014983 TaxID=3364933 RepID=UPI0036FED027
MEPALREPGRPGDPALAASHRPLPRPGGQAGCAACAAPGCERFSPRSHGARRWCATRCGNRARTARAYAARRSTSP